MLLAPLNGLRELLNSWLHYSSIFSSEHIICG